jgi:tetratricopeptide (TPR) repeat protein
MELFKQNKLHDALAEIESSPRAEDYYVKAKIFHELGKIEKSLYSLSSNSIKPYMDRLERKIPGNKGVKFIRDINDLNKGGNYRDALKITQRILREIKDVDLIKDKNSLLKIADYYNPVLYDAISKTYLNLAIENYTMAMQRMDDTKVEKGLSQIQIGECYFDLRDYKSALQYYSKVNPDKIMGYNHSAAHLCFSHFKVDNRKAAEEIEKRFINDLIFRSELGYYFYISGEKEKGKRLIQEAYRTKNEEIFKKFDSISFSEIKGSEYPIFRNHAFLNAYEQNYHKAIADMELVINFDEFTILRNSPLLFIELAGMKMYLRRFEDVLRLLHELSLYYPEVSPIWNVWKIITIANTGG